MKLCTSKPWPKTFQKTYTLSALGPFFAEVRTFPEDIFTFCNNDIILT